MQDSIKLEKKIKKGHANIFYQLFLPAYGHERATEWFMILFLHKYILRVRLTRRGREGKVGKR